MDDRTLEAVESSRAYHGLPTNGLLIKILDLHAESIAEADKSWLIRCGRRGYQFRRGRSERVNKFELGQASSRAARISGSAGRSSSSSPSSPAMRAGGTLR